VVVGCGAARGLVIRAGISWARLGARFVNSMSPSSSVFLPEHEFVSYIHFSVFVLICDAQVICGSSVSFPFEKKDFWRFMRSFLLSCKPFALFCFFPFRVSNLVIRKRSPLKSVGVLFFLLLDRFFYGCKFIVFLMDRSYRTCGFISCANNFGSDLSSCIATVINPMTKNGWKIFFFIRCNDTWWFAEP
jgi:hypothetical protein